MERDDLRTLRQKKGYDLIYGRDMSHRKRSTLDTHYEEDSDVILGNPVRTPEEPIRNIRTAPEVAKEE